MGLKRARFKGAGGRHALRFEPLEPRLCLTGGFDLEVVAQTQSSLLLTRIGQGVSINDNGYVAFQGESLNSGGQAADNVYAHDGDGVNRLMNPVFMYTNDGVDSSVPGTQSIFGQVQINNSNQVLARRRLNAQVLVGGVFGTQQTAPLTYLETWDATQTSPPGGLPVALAAMGVPAASTAPLWLFVNPSTAGVFPSPLQFGSPYDALFGPSTINNFNQVNFSAIIPGEGNNRVSSNTNGDLVLRGGISSAISPMLADNGWYAITLDDGRVFAEPWSGGDLQNLAGSGSGYSDVSLAGISDDGRYIVFAGVNSSTGAGLYIAGFNGARYDAAVKLIGVTGDGKLDPGETHNDVNGNGVVDAGEDVGGLSSYDLSSRVNVNKSRTGYTVAFLGTDTTGNEGLFTLSVAADTPSPLGAPTSLAMAGESIVGLPGVVSSLAIHDSVNNQGQIAFWVESSTGVQAVVKAVPPPPAAVVVLTHGFGNAWTGLTSFGLDPIAILPGFLDGWHELSETFSDVPLADSPLDGELVTYVANWNSSDGWVDAALSLLAGVVLETQGLTLPAFYAFRNVFDQMNEAGLNAERAAIDIVADLRRSGLIDDDLTDLSQSGAQTIELIGHSRGGAVNARVAQILTDAGYRVEDYIALDGYSTDWPDLGGLLGDIDINGTIGLPGVQANINSAVNFRVEDGLAEFVFDALGPAFDLLGMTVFGVTSTIVTPALKDAVRTVLPDWKAPIRSSFGSNETILGGTERSNHLNITPIYNNYDVAAQPAGVRPYLLDTHVGQVSGRATPGPAQAKSSPSDYLGNDLLQGFFGFEGFADWDFEQTHANLEVGQREDVMDNDEPLVRLWGALIADPRYALSTFWQTSGDVAVVVDAGDAAAQLTETSTTSLGQLVAFRPSDRELTFDLDVLAADEADELTIELDGELVASIALATATPGRQTIALPADLPAIGKIGFELHTAGGTQAVVRIDEVELAAFAGDYNFDGSVDAADYTVWRDALGERLRGEANSDGTVDSKDYEVWRDEFGSLPPAGTGSDFNGDGSVDSADYTVWRDNVDARISADGNRDGDVNLLDYQVWRASFQAGVAAPPAASTPAAVSHRLSASLVGEEIGRQSTPTTSYDAVFAALGHGGVSSRHQSATTDLLLQEPSDLGLDYSKFEDLLGFVEGQFESLGHGGLGSPSSGLDRPADRDLGSDTTLEDLLLDAPLALVVRWQILYEYGA